MSSLILSHTLSLPHPRHTLTNPQQSLNPAQNTTVSPQQSTSSLHPQLTLHYYPQSEALQIVLRHKGVSDGKLGNHDKVQCVEIGLKQQQSAALALHPIYQVKRSDSQLPHHIARTLITFIQNASQANTVKFAIAYFVGEFGWDTDEEYWIMWLKAIKERHRNEIQDAFQRSE